MEELETKALLGKKVEKIRKDYEKDPKNPPIRHALAKNQATKIIFDTSSMPGVTPHFSIEVKTMPVCNQKASGRCWIFAGLNILREMIAKKLNIKEFELSQNYVALFDKIEKANFMLEAFITLADKDHNDPYMRHLLRDPVGDGGQWDMFVNLVKKYGIVPKDAFPETFQSENTRDLDVLLNSNIRRFAYKAHELKKEGKLEEIRKEKEELMEKIYHMFLNAFGVPPKSFDFQYEDKDGKYHIERGLTPKSFFDKYIGEEIDEYQSLINSPTKDKPYGKNFTIDFLGNVIEGKAINHLNISMERMKELIIAQLKDGLPVWFGSDVGFYRDREYFAWDSNAFDYDSTFGMPLQFEKEAMLDYWNSAMNHAMVITGVDIVDGEAKKWKIENSWGPTSGLNGYHIMSKDFFDVFVYQAVILKKYLNEDELKAIKEKPTLLPPWDPMGTLA